MTTVEKIKLALRISHDKLDDAIEADIAACLADLQMVGVRFKGEDDPLIFNAIQLWCRALYTDDPAKAAVWQQRYEGLKACLMLAEGYGWEAGADE
jgi:DNA polymerase III psi subunit